MENIILGQDLRPISAYVPLLRYRTNHYSPLNSSFATFSIYFADLFTPTEKGSLFMLICIEIFKNWPIPVRTKNYTAETAVSFVRDHILGPFGSLNTIVRHNASYFTEKVLE